MPISLGAQGRNHPQISTIMEAFFWNYIGHTNIPQLLSDISLTIPLTKVFLKKRFENRE